MYTEGRKRVWLAKDKICNALVELVAARRCDDHAPAQMGNGVEKRNSEN